MEMIIQCERVENNIDRDIIDRMNDTEYGYLGFNIKTCSDSILFREYIYLLANAKTLKEEYEMCLLDNQESFSKYNKYETFREHLEEVAQLGVDEWLVDTELYSELSYEIIKRGYKKYLSILWERYMR